MIYEKPEYGVRNTKILKTVYKPRCQKCARFYRCEVDGKLEIFGK